MSDATWAIMPVLAGEEMTIAAISDLLAQSIPTRILIVNQGVDDPFRRHLERISEEYPDRVFVWSHQPCLPSLSATWNRALRFVWETGSDRAFVVNNDVRLQKQTVDILSNVLGSAKAFFVTAVGVTREQFNDEATWFDDTLSRGGPDFSCFMISKEAHEKYPFDEGFVPAFCEDLDTHRRYMLGGDGERIFSINLPYLHLASQTLKQLPQDQREAKNRQIEQGSRAHYAAKWGGPVNHERFTIPFDPQSAQDNVDTPTLQASILRVG